MTLNPSGFEPADDSLSSIAGRGLLSSRPAADLEIIIPAYNEAGRLPHTLQRTAEYLAVQEWRSRVVVVDNGSSDDTVGIVRGLVRGLPGSVPVEVIGCARPGKGAAVRRGILSSTSTHVGFFDADLATPVETLTAAMDLLRSGAAAVIASRHLPGSSFVLPQPWPRRAGGAAFRVLARNAVRGVRDTQCGFKFFRRDAAVQALVQTRTSGFAFDVELLLRLQRDGGAIVEIPVAWTDGAHSTFRPLHDGLRSFRAVLRLQQGSSK